MNIIEKEKKIKHNLINSQRNQSSSAVRRINGMWADEDLLGFHLVGGSLINKLAIYRLNEKIRHDDDAERWSEGSGGGCCW